MPEALGRAVHYLTQALTLHRQIGDRRKEGATLCGLAAVEREAGRHTDALHVAEAALARDTGDRRACGLGRRHPGQRVLDKGDQCGQHGSTVAGVGAQQWLVWPER